MLGIFEKSLLINEWELLYFSPSVKHIQLCLPFWKELCPLFLTADKTLSSDTCQLPHTFCHVGLVIYYSRIFPFSKDLNTAPSERVLQSTRNYLMMNITDLYLEKKHIIQVSFVCPSAWSRCNGHWISTLNCPRLRNRPRLVLKALFLRFVALDGCA